MTQSGKTTETAIDLANSSRPATSQELVTSLGDNSAEPESEPFPFMRLPLEIRNMVYKELLIQPGSIEIGNIYEEEDRFIYGAFAVRKWMDSDDNEQIERFRQTPVCKLFLTSRTVYRESTPLYFGRNVFGLTDLGKVLSFLGRLSPNLRRAVTSLELKYVGTAPAQANKILATCTGLRQLSIIFSYQTAYMMRGFGTSLMKLRGLKDLLKLRGLKQVGIERDPRFSAEAFDGLFKEMPEFEKALEVLKTPHDPKTLARLDKKDYPNKLHRSIFGKANVATRMENKIMGTAPLPG